MDYLGRVAAVATIVGVILHQLGKFSERQKERRRWRTGRDWTHWARTKEGRAILRDLIHSLEHEN